jgi:predicted PurR-regulated permease PerM
MVTFFLLMEFERLNGFLVRLSPLPARQNRLLAARFMEIGGVILVGNGLNALAQGTLGGLLFTLLDVKAPVLYGVVIGVLAFLPIFGAGLVLVPAAVVFLLNGMVGQAAAVLAYHLAMVLAERFWVRPRFFRGQEQMHRLLVLLAIIGGVSLFGLLGIIYGPLMVTAFLTLAGLYRQVYRQEKAPAVPPA